MLVTEEFESPNADTHICKLRVQLKDHVPPLENVYRSPSSTTEPDVAAPSADEILLNLIRKMRNSDVFVGTQHLLLFIDKHLYKFRSARYFNVEGCENIVLRYDRKDNCVYLKLPCLPASAKVDEEDSEAAAAAQLHYTSRHIIPKGKQPPISVPINWSKLKRVSELCRLQISGCTNLYKLNNNFGYGFANRFHGKIRDYGCNLDALTSVIDPGVVSPVQRSLDRHLDEDNSFSAEQYKLNLIELQVPEGHNNPFNYTFNYKDSTLTQDEQCLLHNLTRTSHMLGLSEDDDQAEIDNSLISILLAICYEIRTTFDEVNCESAWTRSALTATISYFEPFYSLRDVVISFLRRSLIYPLYRNYELSRRCVEDCITALQHHPSWIIKQFIATQLLFAEGERDVFNYYIIDDYVRYVANPFVCPPSHLQILAHNLKNILLDLTKEDIGLGLVKLESHLLREIISDIQISAPLSSEDESEDHDQDHNINDDSSAQSDRNSEAEEYLGTESFDSEVFISSDSIDTSSEDASVAGGRTVPEGEQ